MPEKITTEKKNELLQRYDKLTVDNRLYVFARLQGRFSVICECPHFWEAFEEFIFKYEPENIPPQPVEPVSLTEAANRLMNKYYPDVLDKKPQVRVIL